MAPSQVGDAVFLDHLVGGIDRERAVVESRRLPHQQGADGAEIESVGPARIGDVPVVVVWPQADGVAHVHVDRHQRLVRHGNALGQPGRAGCEQHHAGVLAVAQHRLEALAETGQGAVEFMVRRRRRAGAFPGNRHDRRAIGHIVELVAIGGIGNDQPRLARTDAIFDGLGAEGGEQRLVDRAGPPRSDDHHQQFGNARQQASHAVARLDAEADEEMGELAGTLAQLFEGEFAAGAVLAFPAQRNPARRAMAVAAFDGGADCAVEIAGEFPGQRFQRECLGERIVAGHFTDLCFNGLTHVASVVLTGERVSLGRQGLST